MNSFKWHDDFINAGERGSTFFSYTFIPTCNLATLSAWSQLCFSLFGVCITAPLPLMGFSVQGADINDGPE